MFNIRPSAIDQRVSSLKHARDVIRYRQALLSVSQTVDPSVYFVFNINNCLIYLKLFRVTTNLMTRNFVNSNNLHTRFQFENREGIQLL